MYRKGFVRSFIVVALSVFAATTCHAGETWWQHAPATPGDWFVPANWTNGVPDLLDRAYIDNNGTAEIGGSDAHADRLYIGYTNTGILVLMGGHLQSNYDYLGYEAGSEGTVTVVGAGSIWINNSSLCVGRYGQGTLNITNGGTVNTSSLIGHEAGSTGMVTVDGSGSIWTNSARLAVGYWGQGTLNITNGGAVNVTGYTWVALMDGAAGEIHFDGGTLTTKSLLAGATQLTGTGTINTHGLISDLDLLFDSAHGLNQTLTLNSQPGQNITINLTHDSTGYLGAGYTGNGTLAIRDGVSIESYKGCIGCKAGSTGVVTVAGSDSTWTCDEYLSVGSSGHGTLNITNGGTVSNNDKGYIGSSSGSTGVVTVDGSGSMWIIGGRRNRIYVGHYGQGTLNITNGGAVSNNRGYIGHKTGSTGVVTVDGSGSTWACSGYYDTLCVGYFGQGTLNITNGGAVDVTGDTWVAKYGGTGEIHFDSGTLTTESLFVGPTQLTGTGVINTHGLVSDIDILFDSTHGLNQTLTFNTQPGQNITINLNQDDTGDLGAGYAGNGTLAIRDGVSVESSGGYIGYKDGATGVVTVDGSGSTWTNGTLYIGNYGQGTLNITNGGAVSNTFSYISYSSISTGEVTVDGIGSTWTNRYLHVGFSGHGTLDITNGGTVSNGDRSGGFGDNSVGYHSGSTGVVTVDGAGSTWTCGEYLRVGGGGQGTLNITNGGAVSNDRGYIGTSFDSTGVVIVAGSGSTWTCDEYLSVGGSNYGIGGTGELTVSNDGSVEVGDTLKVWGGGTLNIGAAGKVTVGKALVLEQDSTLLAEPGATIHMTGSAFENESTNSANLAGLGNLTMIFEGGSEDIDSFEVAGEDMGAIMAGYDDNFALGTLQLGGADIGYVQLVDDYDNRPDWTGSEALYVENLIIGAGSTLDLNGLNLYYLNFSDNGGTVLNGTPTQVPEPVSVTLLLLGAIAAFRKRHTT